MGTLVVGGAALAIAGLGDSGEQARPEPARLTISVSGDILIHGPVLEDARIDRRDAYDFRPSFARIRPLVQAADLSFCHAETPITGLGPPTGYPVFNSPPSLADAIAWAGWDACSIASNHSLDQGQAGIAAFGRELERAGVAHTGAFTSGQAKRQPLILDSNGVRVALLSYTTNTNNRELPEPYSVNLARDPAVLIADAKRAREAGADAVIINIHWTLRPLLRAQEKAFPRGTDVAPEYVHKPSPQQTDYVRALLRADEVTAVVGQGPHVVQPIRKLAGKYAIFSEGNLIADHGARGGVATRDGLIALLRLRSDRDGARVTGVRYVPIWVRRSDHRVLPVGVALRRGLADRSKLEASCRRTVSVVGSSSGVRPIPAMLPRLPRLRRAPARRSAGGWR